MTIDVDSTIVAVFGRGKQGAAFGYTKVRGYHPQIATCAETGQVLFCRLRGGSAGAARGAKSFLTETFSRARATGVTGEVTLRADSAFHSKAVLATAAKFGVRFSITARQDKRIRAAIEAIDEAAWTPIPYWLSTPEVSGADVAETTYTAFAGTTDARAVRLIVRRVRPTPGSQLALFTSYDYHAFVTDRTGPMLDTEADHRRHAIIEAVHADLKNGPLAHLPSATFTANAAWLVSAAMAYNLTRAAGALASHVHAEATTATVRAQLINVAARVATSARRTTLHLPTNWPWAPPMAASIHRRHRATSSDLTQPPPPGPDRRPRGNADQIGSPRTPKSRNPTPKPPTRSTRSELPLESWRFLQ